MSGKADGCAGKWSSSLFWNYIFLFCFGRCASVFLLFLHYNTLCMSVQHQNIISTCQQFRRDSHLKGIWTDAAAKRGEKGWKWKEALMFEKTPQKCTPGCPCCRLSVMPSLTGCSFNGQNLIAPSTGQYVVKCPSGWSSSGQNGSILYQCSDLYRLSWTPVEQPGHSRMDFFHQLATIHYNISRII